MLPFDPLWLDESWESILRRLESQDGLGTVCGPHGSGKTTFLDALEGHLRDRGIDVEKVFLNRDSPSVGTFPWERLEASRSFWLVDGEEQLGHRAHRRLLRSRSSLAGLVVNNHQPRSAELPLLLQTRTSPGMLSSFMRRLAPDHSLADSMIGDLFHRSGGNLRDALWDCYDQLADEVPR